MPGTARRGAPSFPASPMRRTVSYVGEGLGRARGSHNRTARAAAGQICKARTCCGCLPAEGTWEQPGGLHGRGSYVDTYMVLLGRGGGLLRRECFHGKIVITTARNVLYISWC